MSRKAFEYYMLACLALSFAACEDDSVGTKKDDDQTLAEDPSDDAL